MTTYNVTAMRLGGAGQLSKVVTAHQEKAGAGSILANDLYAMLCTALEVSKTELGQQALDAFACAVLNRHYGKTGCLFGCLDGEPPVCTLNEEQFTRDVILESLFSD